MYDRPSLEKARGSERLLKAGIALFLPYALPMTVYAHAYLGSPEKPPKEAYLWWILWAAMWPAWIFNFLLRKLRFEVPGLSEQARRTYLFFIAVLPAFVLAAALVALSFRMFWMRLSETGGVERFVIAFLLWMGWCAWAITGFRALITGGKETDTAFRWMPYVLCLSGTAMFYLDVFLTIWNFLIEGPTFPR